MTEGVHLILKSAALSRTAVFILQVIFNLLPDHQADAFNPLAKEESSGIVDKLVQVILDGYHKWDAKYFLFIAENGYTKEQMYAFFPLFPMMMRLLAVMLSNLPFAPTFQSCLLLSGALLNFAFFIGAVRALYNLTLRIYGNKRFASLTALSFSFNPASIFFSANYTESLYAFCVFQALCYVKDGSLIKSTFYFVCASTTRSNGLVNFGFPAYFMIETVFSLHQREKKILQHVALCVLKASAIAFIIIVPFCAFNMMAYMQFCTNHGDISSGAKPWCGSYPPLIYQYVQNKHWELGFLNYYQFRKIPNILLATPCAILIFYGVFYYLSVILENLPLGLRFFSGSQPHKNRLLFASKDIFVYVVHVSILTLFGILFMHVEVVTRFIFSSSPFPNWVSASILMRDLSNANISFLVGAPFGSLTMIWNKLRMSSKLLVLYYAMYVVIGTLLHVNFLPWT